MPTQKPGGGTQQQSQNQHEYKETKRTGQPNRSVPSHRIAVLPVICLLHCLNPTPGKEAHAKNNTNERMGFWCETREGKEFPVERASPPTIMPEPPPSLRCTHHAGFVGRRLRPAPRRVGGIYRRTSPVELVPVPTYEPAGLHRRESKNAPTCLRPTRRTKTKSTRLHAQPAPRGRGCAHRHRWSQPAPEHVLTFPP